MPGVARAIVMLYDPEGPRVAWPPPLRALSALSPALLRRHACTRRRRRTTQPTYTYVKILLAPQPVGRGSPIPSIFSVSFAQPCAHRCRAGRGQCET